MSDNTFWLDSFGITFMSIPPTKRALGVNLPSGKMYPFDNFKEDKVWLALLGLLISLTFKKEKKQQTSHFNSQAYISGIYLSLQDRECA